MPRNRITEILHGQRAISADTALRLGRYFGTSAKLWTGLQATHDLEATRRELGDRPDAEVAPRTAWTTPQPPWWTTDAHLTPGH